MTALPIIKIENRKDLQPEVMKHIKQTDYVIDIGCGIRPQQLIKPKVQVCIEPYAEYIKHLENILKNPDRTYVMINSTWDILNQLPSNSADTILFTDVIEHLEKKREKD
ncbi:hypothetical protein [Bacillus sp. P14.5]|uniref:hypothetical protein n=1 Tax=Bacillus sp. P14.5 TaxID=1983400 RepID=UPI000DEB27C7|nr:hypothetical protein [Bacillus sp. P14.5]